MLQILDFTRNNIIATKAEGKLSEHDIEKIHPLIHNILDRDQKVRWYFEMENFSGWDAKGLWEDLKVDLKHASDYERIAMVGDKEWQDWMTQFMKPFTSAAINYFDLAEKEAAKAWIEN
ncbi:STAS/SEC14 domain-containing protein [Pontibacter sp. 172403-2]|uniref:STAS/SEC14 domain-containing protein n=1 Tax=Pontibacter rufus TaxID=2791028 RepID=UPI0018B009E2|nr:STAS/SEC14 domain-containing protein [Pontibacter sp. 172403-2]MBF9252228.1 STAS/SEC14 domain-containing protein [Pontibacter sp. 172403-2]